MARGRVEVSGQDLSALKEEIDSLKKEVAALKKQLVNSRKSGADPRVDKLIRHLKLLVVDGLPRDQKFKNLKESEDILASL